MRIALIMDWDDTLCPDSISALIQSFGLDEKAYWEPLDQLVQEGWDIVTAFMHGLYQLFNEQPELKHRAYEIMSNLAKSHPGFPDAQHIVRRCREHIKTQVGERVILESYIVSSGLEHLITPNPISQSFDHLWASSFHFERGAIAFPKNVLNFSDKLRCLEQIRKNCPKDNAFSLTQKHEGEELPYQNMIYVGDGYTDIPCFAKIKARGGRCLGVTGEHRPSTLAQQLLKDGRVHAIAPADYGLDGKAMSFIFEALDSILISTE